jgi:hypothetical protein
MGDQFRKVQPGDPLKIPAEAWNALVDLSQQQKNQRHDQLSESEGTSRQTTLAKVRNQTGVDSRSLHSARRSSPPQRTSENSNANLVSKAWSRVPARELASVYVQFERFRAAQYSRELSDKVWRGCVKIAEQGYWAGGPPPYGLQRLLLDEKREPLNVLQPGQRKGIQNQRVTLVEGPPEEVQVIRRIFEAFVVQGHSEYKIAEDLNRDGILSPSGRRWGAGGILARLRNEKYAGTMVYNQTSGKLKTPKHPNPPEKWVRTPEAFTGVIDFELYLQAQEILEKRKQRYDPDYMLRMLDMLYQTHGMIRPGLLRTNAELPSAGGYSREFGSLDAAFQNLFDGERTKARDAVHEQIRSYVPETLAYSDFLVLDQKLTVSIQPAVPIPHGYETYWPLRRDTRPVIDMTLGVLLSEPADFKILGFIALPRFALDSGPLRFTSTSTRTELFGRPDLKFLQQLL